MSLPSRFPERPAVTHCNHNEHYHGFLAELVPPGGTLAVLGLAAPSAVDHALGVVAMPADTAVGC